MRVYLTFFLILILCTASAFAGGSSAGSSEYSLGGGVITFTKSNSNTVEPEYGYLLRLQNGNGEATYFNFVSNLEVAMSGKGTGSFKDENDIPVQNVDYDLYIINYSLGMRFSTAPGSPILPYLGAGGIISVATFQFKDQTGEAFPQQQRGFMYGYNLVLGLDLFLSGSKDNGWGLRLEGDIQHLYHLSKFIMGTPEINSASAVLMIVATY